MSLRAKLLLVALSILTLPWAGWQFVRQMETLLRQGQEQALTATAEAVVRALAVQAAARRNDSPGLFVPTLQQPPALDGDDADWQPAGLPQRHFASAEGATTLDLALGNASDMLHVFARVHDTTPVRGDAHWPNAAQRDHLRLRLDGAHGAVNLRIANAASGALVVADANGRPPPLRIVGEWRDDADGYRVELRLPQGYAVQALALSAFDADDSGALHRAGTPGDAVWSLRHRSATLSAALRTLLPPGARARLLDGDGWVLAAAGELDDAASATQVPAWRRWLYRWLLLGRDEVRGSERHEGLHTNAPETAAALAGRTAATWRRDPNGERLLLSVAVPRVSPGGEAGALLLERESESVLLLTDRALSGLAGATLLALIGAGAVVFVFAGRLSTRVRRLRDAAEKALDRDGRVTPFPRNEASDEIGDLARSFARLLDEVSAYTSYLRSLASKLSHEINTPLAIVRSSLDNLPAEDLPAHARPYLERARSGVERLGALVRSMSEASRIEQAIASAEPEEFDLSALVREAGEAYRALLAPRRLEVQVAEPRIALHGAPELIVQALDKLIDNARSFCPEDGWIRIALTQAAHGAVLSVANAGPPLPEAMRDKLFDSLVSVRSRNRADGSIHLGLGLHVVKLVVELHQGDVHASDLPKGEGVQFELRLQGIGRRTKRGR